MPLDPWAGSDMPIGHRYILDMHAAEARSAPPIEIAMLHRRYAIEFGALPPVREVWPGYARYMADALNRIADGYETKALKQAAQRPRRRR